MDLGKDVVLFDRSDPDTGAGAGSVVPGGATFESQTISGGEKRYRGEKVSVTFRDADIREVFFFFGDLMKMNLVLDPDVSGRIDIRLRQVPWDQAFFVILKNQGLDAIEEDNVIRIAKTTKLRQEASERRALKLAQEQEVDPITFTRRLSYAKAQEAMTVLTQVKSDRGKIIADVRTNTVIIMDIPEKRHEYENLIDALDLQTPQVSIEARIVEAQRDFQRSLGIDWGLTARADPALGTQTNLDFPHRANLNADVNLASTTNAGTLGIALGNVLDSVTLDVTLDAFEADGKVRILSAPKVVTQNNQPANIEQGTQIPVVTTTATEIEVQYVPASLRLQVTPQITAEETVIMKVVVENNQPSDTLSVGDTPAIVTERVDTQILVRSGTTAVIGGVYKLSESDSETGIPGLRRIPFLGWLFKNKQFQKTSAELLVFLTPKIITTI
jgi:type IV pilus assembly protein PilQ